MIRTLFIILFLIVYFILSIPAWGVLLIIEKINKPLKDRISLRIVQWAFKVIRTLGGVKTTVIGIENIPKDEAVLYVGNHNGFFDTVIAYSLMPGLTGFVAKKETEKVPLLRVWMRYLYCLFLDRDDIREGLKTILAGIEQIKSGISVMIFPEGTRSKDGTMAEFKEGSFKLAQKSGCKIIPICQNNTRVIFDDHMPFVKAAHTVIEFGKPIDINELAPEDKKFIGAYTKRIIEEMYEKNKTLV